MAFDLRYPNITGATPQEQLQQMKSFLYQTVEQLNYAIGTLEKDSKSIVEQIRDTSSLTDTPEKAQNTFNSIKSLIIKSADIVEVYSEEIKKRLKGEYVAVSDFGTYQESTTGDLAVNSYGIEQNYKNVQKISTDLREVSETLIRVTANIKTGLLYYDDNGVPRYGLEIGERAEIDGVESFNPYARFISDRLSFHDQNGFEVAYISNYKLYITNVEITGNLKLGGYLYDTSNGIAHKWVGRS
jgi:hypothetical protein